MFRAGAASGIAIGSAVFLPMEIREWRLLWSRTGGERRGEPWPAVDARRSVLCNEFGGATPAVLVPVVVGVGEARDARPETLLGVTAAADGCFVGVPRLRLPDREPIFAPLLPPPPPAVAPRVPAGENGPEVSRPGVPPLCAGVVALVGPGLINAAPPPSSVLSKNWLHMVHTRVKA